MFSRRSARIGGIRCVLAVAGGALIGCASTTTEGSAQEPGPESGTLEVWSRSGPEAAQTYQAVFAASPIETIRKMRDDFARIAKDKFPGGRQTKDEVDSEAPSTRQTPQINNAAYGA